MKHHTSFHNSYCSADISLALNDLDKWTSFIFLVFFVRYDEMSNKFSVEYIAGGSTQNSIKVAQVKYDYPLFDWF